MTTPSEPGHASPSTEEHRRQAPTSVLCAVITISDTRTPDDDKSGQIIHARLESAGHKVRFYRIVPDDPQRIRQAIEEGLKEGKVRAVLLNGGTGIAGRDQTYETICGMIEKRLDGFGEIFRVLSFNEIGPAAMLSRAVAGTIGNAVMFSMPGSPHAVTLAMEKLIAPELGHFIRELDKKA